MSSKIHSIDLNYKSNKRSDNVKTVAGTIIIDGQKIEFAAGDTIMQAAERAGVAQSIPRYCYHPGLSIAGSCRMCTVEVEKAPKLMTSCSTPAANGMVVHTKSEKVIKSRNGVMEFLLTNHPLDCPVCDQAGECELQEYDFEYGPSTSRFLEEKRVFSEATTQNLSDRVVLNMNRCINCERCVRFEDEITQTHDLYMDGRSWKKTLTLTDEEKKLTSNYQGCLTDICPVGALTFRDFRFKKRVWFLKQAPSICDRCSKGCSIAVHSEQGVIYRYTPLYNEKVNGHWMCDEGRVSYHDRQRENRLLAPMKEGKVLSWEAAIAQFSQLIQTAQASKKTNVQVIIGTDATLEEAKLLQTNLPSHWHFNFYNGVDDVLSSADDKKIDHLLKMKDKTPNTRGMESLGLKPFKTLPSDCELLIIFKNGRAHIPVHLTPVPKHLVFIGVFFREELADYHKALYLPGFANVEKSGTFINADNITQHFVAGVTPAGYALSMADIFAAMHSETAGHAEGEAP